MKQDADLRALMLSERAIKALTSAGIKTAAELVGFNGKEWREMKAGRETMIEIMAAVIYFARKDIDDGFRVALRNAWRDKTDAEEFRRLRASVLAGLSRRDVERIQRGELI